MNVQTTLMFPYIIRIRNSRTHSVGEMRLTSLKSRRDQVFLTRCRIGHSRLTHGHLLKGELAPECIPCQCPLTLRHMLVDAMILAIYGQMFIKKLLYVPFLGWSFQYASMSEGIIPQNSPNKLCGCTLEKCNTTNTNCIKSPWEWLATEWWKIIWIHRSDLNSWDIFTL